MRGYGGEVQELYEGFRVSNRLRTRNRGVRWMYMGLDGRWRGLMRWVGAIAAFIKASIDEKTRLWRALYEIVQIYMNRWTGYLPKRE